LKGAYHFKIMNPFQRLTTTSTSKIPVRAPLHLYQFSMNTVNKSPTLTL